MGVDRRVEMLDAGIDHLLAEIRAGIDDDGGLAAIFAGLLDQQGGAGAAIFRVVRIAGAPVTGDARHARGMAQVRAVLARGSAS